MKISDLIAELTEKDSDLENVLLKIKILARRSGRKSIEEWVDKEISGYPERGALPKYRTLNLILVGSVTNGYTRHPMMRLPILHLEESIRNNLTKIEIYNGVRAINECIRKDNEVRSPVRPEFFSFLEKPIGNGFHIEEAHTSAGATELIGIISTVKKAILDFLLEIEGKIKDEEINTSSPSQKLITAAESAESSINSSYSLGF